jgi:thiosulfate/3-mercaptopyruvate sulfurtransferase
VTRMAVSLPSPLVSTQWLADHLGADDLVVVDASVISFTQPNGKPGRLSGHEQYIVDGHIPGALFADLIDDFSDPDGRFPYTRPDSARFAAAAGALGIGPETTVVVYDTGFGQFASRLWWLFRAFGHDNAAVLDGGLTAWIADDRPIERGHLESAPTTFAAIERPDAWVDKAFVERVVRGEEHASLICTLSVKEIEGRGRPGHIPGSSAVPLTRLVDRAARITLADEQLREALAPALGAPRIVAYCSGGIAAATAALQLVRLGETNVAIYDGSLNEWAADPDAPLVTAGSGALV